MALARRHGLVENIVAGDASEQLAIAAAETGDAVGRERHFTDGQQDDFVARAGRALTHGVERADLLQGVAEQIKPQRLDGAGRKEVDQAAANRELARFHHCFGSAVAVLAEELRQPGDIDRLALAQDGGRIGV